jgi:hypothetical protein
MPERVCGACTLCCKLIGVPETKKPPLRWCEHCTKAGCAVHPTRPQSCRNFECFWLMESGFPEDLRPDLCGFVVAFNEGQEGVVVHVDPDRPDALTTPSGEDMMQALLAGFDPIFVVCGTERMMIRRSATE